MTQTADFKARMPPPTPRILVVDDEPRITKVLARVLASWGVEEVHSCAEAIAAVERALQRHSSFDLVLCDLSMPDGSGRQVYETLTNRVPELRHRWVFLSGGPSMADERFMAEHGIEHVQKPGSVSDLRNLAARYLEGGHG